MRKFRIVALIALLALLATTFASVSAQGGAILEAAAGNADLSTLVSLVQAAGLAETLGGEGPFTVFAPTNDAFAKLPEPVLAYLSDPANVDLLEQILTYHVVPGKLMASDVVAASTLTTLEGGDITVSVLGDQVKVNAANITASDLEASNGVIHVVNSLIMPEIGLPAVDPLTLTGNITSAGSSTVYPVTQRLADLFRNAGFAGSIEVASVGTGAGFERFCGPEETATDISNASRPIKEAEATLCRDQGREPLEFYIGVDAVAVVVNPALTCVENLTLADLAKVFSGEVKTWNEVVPACDATEIKLFSPGTDSGTFDFFVEVVFDQDAEKILNVPGIQLSENDNVLVEGVAGSEGGIGYFGYAYYPPNRERIRAVNVEGVEPNESTAESGAYPLSRPLFIYSTADYLAERPQVAAFVNFYLDNVNAQLGTEDGQIAYFPVSSDALNVDRLEWLAATEQ